MQGKGDKSLIFNNMDKKKKSPIASICVEDDGDQYFF